MDIQAVIRRHQDRLMTIPGVTGVAEGESQGSPVVLVMVHQLTPELKRQIPRELDGVPVQVDPVGDITAF